MTQRSIDAVLAGKQVAGPIKTRILRALNHVLEQKKQEKVELAAIFDPTPRPKEEAEGRVRRAAVRVGRDERRPARRETSKRSAATRTTVSPTAMSSMRSRCGSRLKTAKFLAPRRVGPAASSGARSFGRTW